MDATAVSPAHAVAEAFRPPQPARSRGRGEERLSVLVPGDWGAAPVIPGAGSTIFSPKGALLPPDGPAMHL